ncbi:MAG TPA: molybdopterin dinucleotide binding domain-containing protein, partial [Thermoanaerobaculia bacterium]
SNSGAFRFPPAAEAAPPTRTVNMNRLGATLLEAEPPVRALFVYNCNPLATMPDQERVRRGLLRDDLFTIVFDAIWTDTARHADLVLPATAFLEHDDLARGYGAMVLQRSAPVATPAGEARPNLTVFADLCRRLGLDRPGEGESVEAVTDLLVPPGGRIRGELDRDGIAVPDTGPSPVQFVDSFPLTADRRAHLVPPELDAEAPLGLYGFQDDPATPAFPLALISPATNRTISSTFGQLHRKQVALDIHPEDAAHRGIADGDVVRVWNDLGEVRVAAHLSNDLKPGLLLLPKGLWSHNTLSGTTANALAPATLADLGSGACFNDARVEVAKVV